MVSRGPWWKGTWSWSLPLEKTQTRVLKAISSARPAASTAVGYWTAAGVIPCTISSMKAPLGAGMAG